MKISPEYLEKSLEDLKAGTLGIRELAAYGSFFALLQTAHIIESLRALRDGEKEAFDDLVAVLEKSVEINTLINQQVFDQSEQTEKKRGGDGQ